VEQYQGKDFPIPVKRELIDAIKDVSVMMTQMRRLPATGCLLTRLLACASLPALLCNALHMHPNPCCLLACLPVLSSLCLQWEADMHAVEEATVRAKLGIPVKAAVTWEEPEVGGSRGHGCLRC
jgi:hypothetical protein